MKKFVFGLVLVVFAALTAPAGAFTLNCNDPVWQSWSTDRKLTWSYQRSWQVCRHGSRIEPHEFSEAQKQKVNQAWCRERIDEFLQGRCFPSAAAAQRHFELLASLGLIEMPDGDDDKVADDDG